MTRQTRTMAVVALCVLSLHVGAIWALQRGLLARPHMVSPRIPMQVRLVTPTAPADDTPAVPDVGGTRETDLLKPAPPARPAGAPPLDTTPARSLAPEQPEAAPARSRHSVLTMQTQVLQTPADEPAHMPAKTTVEAAPALPAGTGPATDTAVLKPSATTDNAASGTTLAADTAPAAPSARHIPAPVQLPSTDAIYLQNPPPHYPPISRRLREQGTVLVDVLVTDQGLALETRIQRSSGFFRLDNAAAATVATWRFVPGKRAGVAQSMWFTVPIDFQLQ